MILFVLALAADTATTQPPAKAEDANPVVCKQQSRTNTRFTRKVCVRKSDVDARSEADRRAAEELINRPSINPASNGG